MQVLVKQHVGHVLHMGIQIDAGVCQMRAVAQTRQRGRKDRVSRSPETWHHELVPRPRPTPGAMNHHECRHVRPLPFLRRMPDRPVLSRMASIHPPQ